MKIDVTKIEGYADMTTEQKLAALEAYEMDGVVSKALLDKATSEAAGYKKQLREKQTEDEKAKEERDEEFKRVSEELEQLRTERAIDSAAKKWMSLGYDEKLATETAKAMVSGDTEKVFANHAKFIAEKEKSLKAELLKDTPTPPAGEGSKGMTKEALRKMTLDEKAKFAEEQPEQYQALYKED
jgi:hypothetical protein